MPEAFVFYNDTKTYMTPTYKRLLFTKSYWSIDLFIRFFFKFCNIVSIWQKLFDFKGKENLTVFTWRSEPPLPVA